MRDRAVYDSALGGSAGRGERRKKTGEVEEFAVKSLSPSTFNSVVLRSLLSSVHALAGLAGLGLASVN